MKSILYFIAMGSVCFSTMVQPVFAQSSWLELYGGGIVGTPLGQIPEGATGSPGLGLSAGLQLNLPIARFWQLSFQPGYSHKSARYDSPIAGETRVSRSVFGIPVEIPFNFSYEGRATGQYDNHYLDLPLSIRFQSGLRWQFEWGGYAAYLLQGSHTGTVDVRVINLFNVEDEPFDESANLRTWDYGLHAGARFRISRSLHIFSQAQVGLVSVMEVAPEGLEGAYHNVYLKFGLSYGLW